MQEIFNDHLKCNASVSTLSIEVAIYRMMLMGFQTCRDYIAVYIRKLKGSCRLLDNMCAYMYDYNSIALYNYISSNYILYVLLCILCILIKCYTSPVLV